MELVASKENEYVMELRPHVQGMQHIIDNAQDGNAQVRVKIVLTIKLIQVEIVFSLNCYKQIALNLARGVVCGTLPAPSVNVLAVY